MKAIFAVDSNGGIGKDGTLPWPKNKDDFAWFKQHTLGKTVVMGRKTWDDPAFPKPLPNRTNIIVTSKPIDIPGVITVQSIDDPAIPADAVIIGGAQLIQSFINRIDTVYVTRFSSDYQCDTFIDTETLLDNFTFNECTIKADLAFETWLRCNNT